MTFNMNNGRSRFFEIKDLNTRANLCKNNCKPEIIKNDNGDVAINKFLCDMNVTKNSINFKKYDIGE